MAGRFEPVRRVEPPQDERDVDAGRLDVDHERRRDEVWRRVDLRGAQA